MDELAQLRKQLCEVQGCIPNRTRLKISSLLWNKPPTANLKDEMYADILEGHIDAEHPFGRYVLIDATGGREWRLACVGRADGQYDLTCLIDAAAGGELRGIGTITAMDGVGEESARKETTAAHIQLLPPSKSAPPTPPPPPPPPPRPPPPLPPPPPQLPLGAGQHVTATPKAARSSGDDPSSALLAAIEAQRVKAEARALAIEAGEVAVVDPREQRLEEQREASQRIRTHLARQRCGRASRIHMPSQPCRKSS